MEKSKIILSAKVSNVSELIKVYTSLAEKTVYPLHLGLTEAGMGMRGIVSSVSALSILINQNIGDTIRVSAGLYTESNPVLIPRNVTIDGDDLRNTKIIPTNTGQDLFHVDNGCLIQNCSFVGAANTGAMVAYHPPREVLNVFDSAVSGAVCTLNLLRRQLLMLLDSIIVVRVVLLQSQWVQIMD